MEAAVAAVIERFTFPVAVAVVGADGVIGSWGDLEQSYPWMSVTKLVTARTVLRGVEDGRVDLDDSLGPAGATLEMCLAHASGLGFAGDVQAAPLTKRIYSNAGYELAAAHVAQNYGVAVEAFVGDFARQNLGLAGTSFARSAAWGLSGSCEDLAGFTQELLAPRRIDPMLDALATRPVYPQLAGVLPGYGMQRQNLWGLGPEIRGDKHPHWCAPAAPGHVFGHFGQSGAFVWVDRQAGIAACFLGGQPFGSQHKQLWPDLNQAIYSSYG